MHPEPRDILNADSSAGHVRVLHHADPGSQHGLEAKTDRHISASADGTLGDGRKPGTGARPYYGECEPFYLPRVYYQYSLPCP